jgi:hypothetical protein
MDCNACNGGWDYVTCNMCAIHLYLAYSLAIFDSLDHNTFNGNDVIISSCLQKFFSKRWIKQQFDAVLSKNEEQ